MPSAPVGVVEFTFVINCCNIIRRAFSCPYPNKEPDVLCFGPPHNLTN